MADGRAEVVCLKSWNADLICRIPRPMLRGETLVGHSFSIAPGRNGIQRRHGLRSSGAATAVIGAGALGGLPGRASTLALFRN